MAYMPYSNKNLTRFACLLMVLLMLGKTVPSYGQAENYGSPYSRFALGDRQPFSLAQHRAMGGITTTAYDSASLNPGNPASLTDLKLTNIEFGAIGNISSLANNSGSLYKSNFNFGYLMFGFPVNEKWGTALAFQPYSFTNYNISAQVDSAFGNWREDYNGKGGINQLSWSNGFALGSGFHLGVTATYLFGTINNERLFVYPNPDSLFLFNLRVQDQVRISDVYFTLGLQYRKNLEPPKSDKDRRRSVSFGLTFDLPANLGAVNSFTAERYTLVGSTIRIRDTVSQQPAIEGTIQMPWSLAFGAQYSENNKLVVAVEGSYRNWSDFNQFGRGDSLLNSMQVAAGVQYTPKYNAIGDNAIWKTIRYRAGIRYNQGNLVLREQRIGELGMTFGLGIPLKRQFAMPYMNISAEIGQRGSLDNGLIRERYTRITLGLTLNDRWFVKRKYD